MWIWILTSLIVVALLAVGVAIVFINAMGGAYGIFSATGTQKSLFRWPENLWPRKLVHRFPLPVACINEAERGKPPPDLTLPEIEKAVSVFYARAEAIYAAHKGPKPNDAEERLAEARLMRARAAEHRKRSDEGKAGEASSAWISHADACKEYERLVRELTAPGRK